MSEEYYIKVSEEDGGEVLEIPCENVDTLLLSSLCATFPGATGLKFKVPDSNSFRGVRCAEGCLHAPSGGWDQYTYVCVFPKDNKRKIDEDSGNHSAKTKKLDNRKCTDLVILGMAWKTDDETIKDYFSKYGEVVMVQVKRNPSNNMSKGYGFIRFADMTGQILCLSEKHYIDGRWCEVKIPNSKIEGDRQEVCNKIFVGHLTEDLTSDILKEHFTKYGEVREVYIPKPFRSFAFVTFTDSEPVPRLLRQDHIIQGVQVQVGTAVPKINNSSSQNSSHNGFNHSKSSSHHGHSLGGMNNQMNSMPFQSRFGNHGASNTPSQNQQNYGWGFNSPPYNTMPNIMPVQSQQQMPSQSQNRNGGGDMSQNTAALAALHMLNNPNVVAAIMSMADQAAGGGGRSKFKNDAN